MAYKVIQTRKYTETVVYNDEGQEVARFPNYDDVFDEESSAIQITDEELEGYLTESLLRGV